MSGAQEYTYRLNSAIKIRAKKMDRNFVVKTFSGELESGNAGDYMAELNGHRVRIFATDFEPLYR